ncbi:MAG: hydroxyethylthiazole kinase-like uncharacterized protein yjeF [Rhodothermales bacterium]|jgi:hydroxyethylthiazole kinase-like uncharacterized protein yjeF
MKMVSAETMRSLDDASIAGGTSGLELMERAGIGAVHELLDFLERLPVNHARRIAILVGKGNNGGDGYVMARILQEMGWPVEVYAFAPAKQLKGDAATNAERLPAGLLVTGDLPIEPGTVFVDCLLGTGISGAVREPFLSVIEQVNASICPVVAIDIPSGLNADTGEVANSAIVADLTITMALPKAGLLRGAGPEHRGALRVVDIGIPPTRVFAAKSEGEATLAPDVRAFLGRVARNSHKGSMGRIAIVGGSRQYPNAPILAATAALRAGGGLVAMAIPEAALPLLGRAPHAVIPRLFEDAPFREWLPSQDVVAVGPGLGRNDDTAKILREVLTAGLPTVIDADALAAIPDCREFFPRAAATIITPHPGEMQRLADGLRISESDRLVLASRVAEKLGVVVVLKGADCIVAEPYGIVSTNTSGTPGLATAGSGDVLTGLTAAWLYVARTTFVAAQAAVFVHGLAGELAPCGDRNLIADDLPELIGRAMHTLSPFA